MQISDIDPARVADEVCRLVRDHVARQVWRLDPTLALSIPEDAGGMGLRPTAHALAEYARSGLPVWDWTDHGMASDGLLDVVSALYGTAASGITGATTPLDAIEGDPADEIDLVLVAAGARIRIDQRGEVTARDLAALSGLSSTRVRQLISAGELHASDERPARIQAEDAARWLAARGVPGYR